jgi:hypothetical protein
LCRDRFGQPQLHQRKQSVGITVAHIDPGHHAPQV